MTIFFVEETMEQGPKTIVDFMRTPEMISIDKAYIQCTVRAHLNLKVKTNKEWDIFSNLVTHLLISPSDNSIGDHWIPYKAPNHPLKWAPGVDFSKEETYVMYMYKRIKKTPESIRDRITRDAVKMVAKRVSNALMQYWMDTPKKYKGEWLLTRLKRFCLGVTQSDLWFKRAFSSRFAEGYTKSGYFTNLLMGSYRTVNDRSKKAKKDKDRSIMFDKRFHLKQQRNLKSDIEVGDTILDDIKEKRAALTLALLEVSIKYDIRLTQQEDRLNKRGMYNLPLGCKKLHEIIYSEEGIYSSNILTNPNWATVKIIGVLKSVSGRGDIK